MAKPSIRGAKMDEKLVIRCTLADKAKLNLLAQRRGIDRTTLIRMTMIEQGLIDATCTKGCG